MIRDHGLNVLLSDGRMTVCQREGSTPEIFTFASLQPDGCTAPNDDTNSLHMESAGMQKHE